MRLDPGLQRSDPCECLELHAAPPFVGDVEVPEGHGADDGREPDVGQQEPPVLAREDPGCHSELALPGQPEPVDSLRDQGDGTDDQAQRDDRGCLQ